VRERTDERARDYAPERGAMNIMRCCCLRDSARANKAFTPLSAHAPTLMTNHAADAILCAQPRELLTPKDMSMPRAVEPSHDIDVITLAASDDVMICRLCDIVVKTSTRRVTRKSCCRHYTMLRVTLILCDVSER